MVLRTDADAGFDCTGTSIPASSELQAGPSVNQNWEYSRQEQKCTSPDVVVRNGTTFNGLIGSAKTP